MSLLPCYVHPLPRDGEELPSLFTYPFRYTPHPLCRRAAAQVQQKLREMRIAEGKMYGVLVARIPQGVDGSLRVRDDDSLCFLAAYSGQLRGSFNHPWFVPPVVDYLAPDGHFQQQQQRIVALSARMKALSESPQRRAWQQQQARLRAELEAAVAKAKNAYEEGKRARERWRTEHAGEAADPETAAAMIRQSQQQKADIHRAKQLHKEELADLEAQLTAHNAHFRQLLDERRQRSEALQQWLFRKTNFLNANGEQKNLLEIFCTAHAKTFRQPLSRPQSGRLETSETAALGDEALMAAQVVPPSGAGECCAPKLLQAAYALGLQPLAMGEFWWGRSRLGHYHQPGAFFPACRSKCKPILEHMLQGLQVEPDPADYYNKVHACPRVLWEDEHLAVVVKPEGWCSIPGKSHQANLLDEAFRLWPDITGSVIVHRLDQDTSGLLVVAKNAQVHRALSSQFERREVQKRYVALLEGALEGEGEICLPLAPDLENMPWQRVDHEQGREAVTRWKACGTEERMVRKRHESDAEAQPIRVTRVLFWPQTGRTHQLRVHAADPEGLGMSILGDRMYGHMAERLYLHAEALEFTHPVTHQRMVFEEPPAF